MGSWVRCKCESLVHKNLFCGAGISLIVSENTIDGNFENMNTENFISSLIESSSKLLKCSNCGRLILINEQEDKLEVEFFLNDK